MTDTQLNTLRAKLDDIDRQCVALLKQRLEIGRRIAEYKQTSGQTDFDPLREQQLIIQHCQAAEAGCSAESITEVMQTIINVSRNQAANEKKHTRAIYHVEEDTHAVVTYIKHKALHASNHICNNLQTLLSSVMQEKDTLGILACKQGEHLSAIQKSNMIIVDCWLTHSIQTDTSTLMLCITQKQANQKDT